MRYLKAAGMSWYDFGGVAHIDRSKGIYNFKEKFGGSLVLLSAEWRRTGRVMKHAESAKMALKGLARLGRRL
jgi:lipid II:glycine glycyltransferase (peptidoglycan interpeptide bridge formation enzyme)